MRKSRELLDPAMNLAHFLLNINVGECPVEHRPASRASGWLPHARLVLRGGDAAPAFDTKLPFTVGYAFAEVRKVYATDN
jgi:hypothetical protein